MGEGLEDFLEQKLSNRQRGAHVAEIQGARVERAAGVGLVDEIHVVARNLFWRRGEIVEVNARDRR